MKRFLLLHILLITFSFAKATTFTVTDTTNGTTTDGVSLRWAITQANSFSSYDTIAFDIPGMAPHTIVIDSLLPTIYDTGVLIDGTSQPANGYSGTEPKIIVLNSDTVTKGFYFFVPYTVRVKGLEMDNFTETAIYAFGSAVFLTIEECTFSGNFDGVSIFGSSAHGDVHNCNLTSNLNSGVYVFGAGAYALIENNLISGNGASGIIINGGSDSCTIRGNRIGTDSSGTLAWPNTLHGITVANDNNVIGGVLPGQGNIIAFNGGDGIHFSYGNYNLITRNSIFCNAGLGINLGGSGNNNFPAPVILNATTDSASGTAPAYARLELFYDSSCTNCQGKTFIAEVYADSNGVWSYPGWLLLNSSITATAADTSNNNTSRFSACVVVMTTSLVENANQSSIHVFPNPANTYLNISFDKATSASELNVFNSVGEKVYAEFISANISSIRINTEKFSNGFYFLKIISANGVSISRFAVAK